MRKTLVLIPAFGCDAALYQPQIDALRHRVDILTLTATANRYELMVSDALQLVPERFSVLGTSMGGRLALEIALAAPKRIEGLGIIGAAAGAVADPAAGLLRSQRIRGGEKDLVIAEMADKIAHLSGPQGRSTRQTFVEMASGFEVETLARQSDALAHRTDRWDEIAAITCPTLCLWGVHDAFSPAVDGRRLASGVQRGRYVELPDCGHFPTLEYPDAATHTIANWLTDEVYAASV